MSREIKFRAWHNTAKEMLYPIYNGITKQSYVFRWAEEGQDIEIMQFTGLQDKNGKDIYEGDILKSHNPKFANPEDIIAVKYSGSGFVVYNPNCCDACRNGGGCICDLDEWFGFEVIGNLFENPELLNEVTINQ